MTDQSFLPNPYGEGKIYRSRDLARQFPDGTIEYLGRNDLQIKIRGYRIEIGEIEAEINDTKGVTGAYVCVVGDGEEKKISAWYTANQHGPDEEDLRNQLGRTLAHYMVPQHITKIDKFPTNISGKVDKNQLKLPTQENKKNNSSLTSTEQKLQEIWSDVLKIKPTEINAESNFFQIGGHSLSAAMTCHRINERLKRQITPKQLIKN